MTSHGTRINAVETSKYLRVSRSTLSKWRMRKIGPSFHRCGPRIVYYLKEEVDAWLESCDRDR